MHTRFTAAAHPNLAFVKYWGKADEKLNIPTNSSISVNLSGATTITSVTFSPDFVADSVMIDGQIANSDAHEKVVRHLDRVRQLANLDNRAIVESKNDFPSSAGIASSASAFAALSLAASMAAGLNLSERELSILARKGSGSACRSIPGGFVEWVAGDSDDTSYAKQVAASTYWDIKITTAIIDKQAKNISSSIGHRAAITSPFYQTRLCNLTETLDTVRVALLERDIQKLGMAVEREAISMHAVAMTSFVKDRDWLSGIYYWNPATLILIQAVQQWRHEGLEVYFTLDAGSNVHFLSEGKHQIELEQELQLLLQNIGGSLIISEPGDGAWVVTE